ncbi:MAG TPA: hypothetical protein VN436_01800 [Holophaga sp.]|nr:hypothetical protein [Holophaga sp.]
MFGFNLAIVTKVLPAKHGVLVSYRNAVEHLQGTDDGSDVQSFVRVLERRAHSYGGSTLNLPEVGEMGLVAMVEPGLSVWMGSLPWEDTNQMDSRSGLAAWHHSSGTEVLCTEAGDMQLTHPSGFRITIAALDGGAIPVLQGTSPADKVRGAGGDDPHMVIYHPSGWTAHLDDEGNLKIDSPASVEINVALNSAVTIGGTSLVHVVGDVTLQADSNVVATVAKNASLTVDGTADIHVVGDTTIQADANVNATVASNMTASIGSNATLTVGGTLDATVASTAALHASAITLDAPSVVCTGTLQATGLLYAQAGITTTTGAAIPGNFTVAGTFVGSEAIVNGRYFSAHKHSGVTTGSGQTGAPV